MANAKHRRRRNPATQGAFSFGTPRTILSEREHAAAMLDVIMRRHAKGGGEAPKVAAAARSLDEIIDAHARRRVGPKRASPSKKGRTRMKAKPRHRSARRPRLGRDRHGRFLPRKRKAAATRRAAPKRHRAAARRRPRLGRDSRGRFLKRGAKGRGSARRLRPITRAYVRAARHRKGVKKHMRARRTIRAGQRVAGLVRINPRTGAITMPRVLVANPRRKRKNPRRHHHARRARNPMSSMISTAKAIVLPMGAGAAAGAAAGFLDAKYLSARPTVGILAKLALAFGGAFALRKKHPAIAMGWAGGMVGATGYQFGVKFGGGHVALNGLQGLKGLADMAAEDPEVADLIAGLGDVVPDNMGDAAGDYNNALAGDDAEGMGDVVSDD